MFFSINVPIVYYFIKFYYIGINEGASTSKMNDWEVDNGPINYYGLKLSIDSIKVVNNPSSFEEFLDHGLKDVSIVGIDSEWKPCFGNILNQ